MMNIKQQKQKPNFHQKEESLNKIQINYKFIKDKYKINKKQ